MANVIIKGFKTDAHAKMFMSWFEGQGEQDQEAWFECQDPPLKSQIVDVRKKFEDDGQGNHTMYLK